MQSNEKPWSQRKSFKPGAIREGLVGRDLFRYRCSGKDICVGEGSGAVNGAPGGDGLASFPRGTW